MYCCNRCIEGKLLIHYYLCFVWRELIFKLPMTVKCVLKKRGWEILPCTVGTGVRPLLKLSCLCSRVDLQFLSCVSLSQMQGWPCPPSRPRYCTSSTNWEQACVCVLLCSFFCTKHYITKLVPPMQTLHIGAATSVHPAADSSALELVSGYPSCMSLRRGSKILWSFKRVYILCLTCV